MNTFALLVLLVLLAGSTQSHKLRGVHQSVQRSIGNQTQTSTSANKWFFLFNAKVWDYFTGASGYSGVPDASEFRKLDGSGWCVDASGQEAVNRDFYQIGYSWLPAFPIMCAELCNELNCKAFVHLASPGRCIIYHDAVGTTADEPEIDQTPYEHQAGRLASIFEPVAASHCLPDGSHCQTFWATGSCYLNLHYYDYDAYSSMDG